MVSDAVTVDEHVYPNLKTLIKKAYDLEHAAANSTRELNTEKKKNKYAEQLTDLNETVCYDYLVQSQDRAGKHINFLKHEPGDIERERELEELKYQADIGKKCNARQILRKKQETEAAELKDDLEQRLTRDANGNAVKVPGDKGAIVSAYDIAVNKLKRKQLKKENARAILRQQQANQTENLDYDLTQRYALNADGTKEPIEGDEGAIKAKLVIDSKQVEHDKAVTDLNNELRCLKQEGVLDKLVYDLVQTWSLDENGNRVVIEDSRGELIDKLIEYLAKQKSAKIVSDIDRMETTDRYEILKNALDDIQGLTEADYILKKTNPARLAPNGVVPDAEARQIEDLRRLAERRATPPPDNPTIPKAEDAHPKQNDDDVLWSDFSDDDDTPPPGDPKAKRQERKQNAVQQLAHNLQEPAFSILPKEQQE